MPHYPQNGAKFLFVPDPFLRKEISRLPVVCVNYSKGCTWKGTVEELYRHFKSCRCSEYLKIVDSDVVEAVGMQLTKAFTLLNALSVLLEKEEATLAFLEEEGKSASKGETEGALASEGGKEGAKALQVDGENTYQLSEAVDEAIIDDRGYYYEMGPLYVGHITCHVTVSHAVLLANTAYSQ